MDGLAEALSLLAERLGPPSAGDKTVGSAARCPGDYTSLSEKIENVRRSELEEAAGHDWA
jgi:hypothetical protein